MLLPESFIIQLGLYRISTGEFLPPTGLTVHKPTPRNDHSSARPNVSLKSLAICNGALGK